MPDIFDKATEREEQNLEQALKATLGRGDKVEVEATGECLYCFAEIKKNAVNKRFCNAEHRDLYDAETKRRGAKR